jgi:hypothetical protein
VPKLRHYLLRVESVVLCYRSLYVQGYKLLLLQNARLVENLPFVPTFCVVVSLRGFGQYGRNCFSTLESREAVKKLQFMTDYTLKPTLVTESNLVEVDTGFSTFDASMVTLSQWAKTQRMVYVSRR